MTSNPSANLRRTVARLCRVAVWAGAWLGACGWVPSASAALRAVASAEGGVVVEWERAPGSVPVLGWHVERAMPGGEALRLTEVRVAAGLFDAPATVYRFRDSASPAQAGDVATYRLVAVDPELREWPADFFSVEVESARPGPPAKEGRKSAAFAKQDVGPATVGSRVRIAVTNDGLFWLSAAQIAGVLAGYSEAQVAQAIVQKQFALSCGGEPVAWRAQVDGAGLLFYGQAVRDAYDRRGFYWLDPGPGLEMARTDRRTDQAANSPWFWETVRAETDQHFVPYLPGGLADDYWIWTGSQVTAPTTAWSWSNTVALVDAHPGVKTGLVTAYLSSAYDGNPARDNRTRLFAGTQLVDDRQWPGDERLVQTGTATNLGGASVAVGVEMRREADVTTTTVMIDAIEVRYGRHLRARNNQLLFRPEAGTNLLTVRGFASAAIRAFDVTDPLRPEELLATVAQEGAADWRASWSVAAGESRRFLAVAGAWSPARIDGVVDGGWRQARAGAPHVVIAPRALTNAAAVLVQHRKQRDLDSLLVPLEELFDTFAFGRRDPRAIRLFLAHARANWTAPPAYVCLAGDGHLDYLDVFGQAATRPNHVPPLLDRVPYDSSPSGTLTTFGLDNPLADLDGDEVPDVAIGRLPAQTPAALAAMISRIATYEATDAWKNQVLLVSDKDADNVFAAARERLAARVPAELTIHREGYETTLPVATMRTNFIRAMNAGPALAAFYGHANNVGISTPYFFEHSFIRSYMSSLTNQVRPPLLLAGTCMLNDFAQPHPNSRCLGKGFLDAAPGGAVAVWASASESTLGMSEATVQLICDGLFASRGNRLGDLIQPALAMQAGSASPWTVRSSVLLGDPGSQIRTHLFKSLAIQPATIQLPVGGTAGRTFAVEAKGPWTAAAAVPWISIVGAASGSGNGLVTYRVEPNGGAARRGTITVTGGGIRRTFTVNQWPAAALPGVSAEGDFDGDGAADWVVFEPATGTWRLALSTGAQWSFPWGSASMMPVPADYDGDGLLDFALYRPSNGTWYLRESGGSTRQIQFGWGRTIPVPADYDGDGKADVALFNPDSARWYIQASLMGSYSAQWGWAGVAVVPVPADYDGDGATDLAIYHPASGGWFIFQSITGTMLQKTWGSRAMVPVPGDYNGDGKADIAVFSRQSGQWYIAYTGGGSRTAKLGWASTEPVPADYDGDGQTDVAVFNRDSRIWYVIESSTGALVRKTWGAAGARPVLMQPVLHDLLKLP